VLSQVANLTFAFTSSCHQWLIIYFNSRPRFVINIQNCQNINARSDNIRLRKLLTRNRGLWTDFEQLSSRLWSGAIFYKVCS